MRRPLALFVGFVALAPAAAAADTLSPETLAAVKKATVYIRIEGPAGTGGSGSGFVFASDGTKALIATNHHVVAPVAAGGGQSRSSVPPVEAARLIRAVAPTVVFDSGTTTERVLKAEVLASDMDADLAVLKVTGAGLPRAIPYFPPPALTELTPVFSFGFPFGRSLSTTKGANPAVTVGRASVSSLRTDEKGELATVQIDGAINPGNSGGPVVDATGRLAGVAFATMAESSGIGLVVPAAELAKVMRGRVGQTHLSTRKGADGKLAVRVEVGLVDPVGRVKGVTAHVVTARAGERPANADTPSKAAGSRAVPLTVQNGVAVGEFPADPGTDLFVQASADTPDGAVTGAVKSQSVALRRADDPNAPMPAGWKEYGPRDGAFTVWVPTRTNRLFESNRTVTRNGLRIHSQQATAEVSGGPTFLVSQITLPGNTFTKDDRRRMYDTVGQVFADDIGGKVESTTDVQLGAAPGKEYAIRAGGVSAKMRVVMVSTSRVYVMFAFGTPAQLTSGGADTFLNSLLPGRGPSAGAVAQGPTPGTVNPAPPRPAPQPPRPAPQPSTPVAQAPPSNPVVPPPARPARPGQRIAGGGGDPLFKDAAPDRGLLVGLDVGLGQANFNADAVVAVRPVYRVYKGGESEEQGKVWGEGATRLVSLKAKPGYAVGAVTAQAGLHLDGFSVTFMKVAAGGLDASDAYASEWVGRPATNPTRIGGDGGLVVGVVGKLGPKKTLTGLGLVTAADGKAGGGTYSSRINGGANIPEAWDAAPAGGLLVGLEVAHGPITGNPNGVHWVRPLYRTGGSESAGEQRGVPVRATPAVTTLKARSGYAVGALTPRGLRWCDGLSVTFMKVKADGRLDPADAYESEWVGHPDGPPPGDARLGGDGAPVVGLVTRANPNDIVYGIGLLHPAK